MNKMNIKIKYSLIIGMIVIVVISFIILQANNDNKDSLKSKDIISHIHGIAVDKEDSNRLYIATHHGLFVLIDDNQLYQIGAAEDDLMGFSLDPKYPNIVYSSGHPSTGGNLGFQKSDNKGITWKKIANGVNGPVDFHAMIVHAANQMNIFGWHDGMLQRSIDNGKTWNLVNAEIPSVLVLASDSINENKIYAGTIKGLIVSNDKGNSWEFLSEQLKEKMIIALAVNPKYPNKMFSFSKELGLTRSVDNGATWENIRKNQLFDNEIITHITFDTNNPEVMYFATKDNSIYKSIDSGNTWEKIK